MNNYPFPYLCSGEFAERWFEWLDLYILFQRPPDADKCRKIRAALPGALQDGVSITEDLAHASTGESGTHVVLHNYSRDADDPTQDEETSSATPLAAWSKLRKFNQDMTSWLETTDAICPIRLAYRLPSRRDTIQRDDWHAASSRQAETFLNAFSTRLDPNSQRGFLLERLLEELEYSGLSAGRFERWRNPLWRILQGFAVNVRDVAGKAVQNPEAPFAQDALNVLFEKAKNDPGTALEIDVAAYRLLSRSRFAQSLLLYDRLVQLPRVDVKSLNNALYAVADDNSGLGVQPERARRYLALAASSGPENPAIFYTGACLWYELGEREKTFEWIKLALEHGFAQPQNIHDEPLFEPLRGTARFEELFKGSS